MTKVTRIKYREKNQRQLFIKITPLIQRCGDMRLTMVNRYLVTVLPCPRFYDRNQNVIVAHPKKLT